ncbi:MAG: hypothetical protein AB1778_05650 [Candidatus Bipolaricaulota bacterium]
MAVRLQSAKALESHLVARGPELASDIFFVFPVCVYNAARDRNEPPPARRRCGPAAPSHRAAPGLADAPRHVEPSLVASDRTNMHYNALLDRRPDGVVDGRLLR